MKIESRNNGKKNFEERLSIMCNRLASITNKVTLIRHLLMVCMLQQLIHRPACPATGGATLRSLKSQSSQSEKQQPFGQIGHRSLSINMILGNARHLQLPSD